MYKLDDHIACAVAGMTGTPPAPPPPPVFVPDPTHQLHDMQLRSPIDDWRFSLSCDHGGCPRCWLLIPTSFTWRSCSGR